MLQLNTYILAMRQKVTIAQSEAYKWVHPGEVLNAIFYSWSLFLNQVHWIKTSW